MNIENLNVEKLGGSWCYIDAEGKIVKRLMVDEAYPFVEGMAAIRIYYCFGFIDRNFRIIVEPRYGYGTGDFHEGVAVVRTPGRISSEGARFGYINSKGQEVIPLKYEKTNKFCEGLASVQLIGKWGVINKKDHTVIGFQYDQLSNCNKGNFIFLKGNMFGIISKKNGKELISNSINIDDENMDIFLEYIYSYGSNAFLQKRKNTNYVLIDSEEKLLFTWEIN